MNFLGENDKPVEILIQDVKIYAFSNSGEGHVLVRKAEAITAQGTVSLKSLSSYPDIAKDAVSANRENLVFLGQGDLVYQDLSTAPLKATGLRLVLEEFADDDASINLQISFEKNPNFLAGTFRRSVVNPPQVDSSPDSDSEQDSGRGSRRPGMSRAECLALAGLVGAQCRSHYRDTHTEDLYTDELCRRENERAAAKCN